MKINEINPQYCKNTNLTAKSYGFYRGSTFLISDCFKSNLRENISFTSNPISKLDEFLKFLKVRRFTSHLPILFEKQPNLKIMPMRSLAMEQFEGIQYGIKVFKGLTMKDIQYLSENLHVIAVKRGCNNMCGHCYADAKPSKREMSWEDFTGITRGFKTLRKRLYKLDLFGENLPVTSLEKSTELFYDADCMNLVIKDKKGRQYDFIRLANELYEGLGRKTVFDTSGWNPNNNVMQKRAEKYAEYFAKPENMEKLEQFNLSFNTFNASYIAAVKALKSGNEELYLKLRGKFTDRIANAIYTFTPLLKSNNFNLQTRSFGFDAKNAKHFDVNAMVDLRIEVLDKVNKLYQEDLLGAMRHVKSQKDINEYMNIASEKLSLIDTNLNSVGRMKEFMKMFKIKAPMENHEQTTKQMMADLKYNTRGYKIISGMKLIDADGKVYHMDYARFFPTELQLNIADKSPAPRLANLYDEFTVTKKSLNLPTVNIRPA